MKIAGFNVVLCVMVSRSFPAPVERPTKIGSSENLSEEPNRLSSEYLQTGLDNLFSAQVSSIINFEQHDPRFPKEIPEDFSDESGDVLTLRIRSKRQSSNTTTTSTTATTEDDEPFFDEIPSTEAPVGKPKTRFSIDLGPTPVETSSSEEESPYGPPFRILNIINPGRIFNTGVVAARKTAQNAVEFASKQIVTVSEAVRNTASDIGQRLNFRSPICKLLFAKPDCKFDWSF